ncbi:transposase [Candidatus Chloroploca sp. M-50]|uniref:Transposase n=1 Tax=Candidatus Chloroploca mongolica TaxID=2528176 RepID=A0ABS4DD02_9CHLR|nr:transposase [Candidatus Chloroploca mongolica]
MQYLLNHLLKKGRVLEDAYEFRKHQTSDFVEGLNNKLKVLKRRCFGMTNHRNLFQRITLDLEGYRRFDSQTDPLGPTPGNPGEPNFSETAAYFVIREKYSQTLISFRNKPSTC